MPTPTPTTTPSNKCANDKHLTTTTVVQQAPRTPSEFQFAHRLLRKLVQDSTVFPAEAARRDYVWFAPRENCGHQQLLHDESGVVESGESSLTNNLVTGESCCNGDDKEPGDNNKEDGDENYHQLQLQQQQQQQRRRSKRKTPLFTDYCLRSYTAELNNRQQRGGGSRIGFTSSIGHTISPILPYGNTNNNSTMNSSSNPHRRASSPSWCSSSNNSAQLTTESPRSVCTVDNSMSASSRGGGGDVAIHNSVVRSAAAATELPFRRETVGDGMEDGEDKVVQEEEQKGEYFKKLSRRRDQLEDRTCNTHDAETTTTTITTDSTTTNSTSTFTSTAKNTTKHSVYTIHERELEFGKILGSGGFGQVRLARIKDDAIIDTTTTITNDVSATTSSSSVTAKTTNANFAMKYLSPDKTSTNPSSSEQQHYVSKFERGIADLAMEARYLSVLSHENIVKLWFVCEGSLEEVFNCESEVGGGENKGVGVRKKRGGKNSQRNGPCGGEEEGTNEEEEEEQDEERSSRYHHQHGYFLLLDALCETLLQRIHRTYVPQVIDTPLRIYETNKRTFVNNEQVAKSQLAGRLASLKSIASALQYLHEECNLIYRDIKPSNIGFYRRYDGGATSCTCRHAESGASDKEKLSSCTCSYTDIPKLFDFGLAKELKSKFRKAHPAHGPDDPPTFKLTSATGSRRYMSPEVALREPYNQKTDVYSFGMVLYQISALVVPFYGLEMDTHEQVVVREGMRPDVTVPSKESSVRRTRDFRRHYRKESDKVKRNLMLSKRARCVWPEMLYELIGQCWDEDMRKRPEMREVVERLDVCIEELTRTP